MVSRELLNYFKGDELAANVWLSKYAASGETHPDQMHRRMAKEFARIDEKYQQTELNFKEGISEYGFKRYSLTETTIYELFKDFKHIVPQGSIMSVLGTETIGSLSNCYVIPSPHDSYGGICKTDEEMAQLMKRRAGVGTSLDSLRPGGAFVKNVAKTSTGADSFMSRYSNTTREVAQEGRRGALMLLMSCNHPSIFKFATKKNDRTQVTGANVSVMFTDEFMKAVKADEDFICSFPTHLSSEVLYNIIESDCGIDNIKLNELHKIRNTMMDDGGSIYVMKIKAKELWNLVVEMAWENAEPGIAFIDRVHNYSPESVYEFFKAIACNPCGEQWLNAYDSCRLFALNLFNIVHKPFTKDSYIDYSSLYALAYEQQRLADNLIDLELERIQAIINKIKDDPEPDEIKNVELRMWENVYTVCVAGRRTGCGITALGDMLAALGLKYDSDEALAVIDKVMKTKMEAELDCTIDLAILRGTFEGWNSELEYGNVILNDTNEVNLTMDFAQVGNDFYKFLWYTFPEQVKRMRKYGRRNVSWSTIAPTGTVSIMTQTSSGCEPLFQPFYIRRTKINSNENKKVHFVDQNGDKWQEYPVLHPKFREWMMTFDISSYVGMKNFEELNQDDLKTLFEISPWYKATANDIDWIKRVEIQAILQEYTTNAISSTINLPNSATKEEVGEIYIEAFNRGLKGITVYRDGSRSGVLITEPSKEKTFSYRDAVKRPDTLPCEIHLTTKNGIEYLVAVGLYDQRPYEVFAFKNTWNIPKHSTGNIVKVKKGRYDLNIQGVIRIENITNVDMTAEEEDLTRLVSMSLRHGADITFVAEQLNKTKNIVSFSKALSRVLKKYIPEGLDSSEKCPECNEKLIYREGCKSCVCGYSKC
jgi:ribonucleoside-diphosphate reductase alpha chain